MVSWSESKVGMRVAVIWPRAKTVVPVVVDRTLAVLVLINVQPQLWEGVREGKGYSSCGILIDAPRAMDSNDSSCILVDVRAGALLVTSGWPTEQRQIVHRVELYVTKCSQQ